MRYLFYTNYQSGRSGLSNGIMSVEIGVVLAHLTNRFLVLDGNISPPANIVAYDGRVSNEEPSRITDLIDIPVPWAEPEAVDMEGLESLELTNYPLQDVVFYFPRTLDLSSSDAKCFARNRDHWVTPTGEYDRVPVLRLSEDPLVPGSEAHRTNLSFYSYLFYLNDETRRSVYRLLERMQPKPAFLDLANQVAKDLGSFNAVHLRRGDFKVTYGVTTLDRQPWEAIEAMDQVFNRDEPLVILTDERDDPFFDEIKLAYPDHYFIDWHILDHYGEEFSQLPRTDSLSLAYLSQLVAAEAKEFIGTMTSTFTAIIQRHRGNRGKREVFRYLWNELPEPGLGFERGRHAISDCVPLDKGVMIEQFEGPYTWNRVSQLLNPCWMREWPESFLTPEALATGKLATKKQAHPGISSLPDANAGSDSVIQVAFESLQITVRSENAVLLQSIAPSLGATPGTPARNVITDLSIIADENGYRIQSNGLAPGRTLSESEVAQALRQEIVELFSAARKGFTWLVCSAYGRNGQGLVITGNMGGSEGSLALALGGKGWDLLDSGMVAIRHADSMIVPLGARTIPEGASAQTGRVCTPLAGFLFTDRVPLHGTDRIVAMSPATAVATLIPQAQGFKSDRIGTVEKLCKLAEDRPAAQLSWNNSRQAVALTEQWMDAEAAVVA